ncbi:hypothetical protein ACQRBF_02790 [Peptoniphilaceae bacterium SGI.131]
MYRKNYKRGIYFSALFLLVGIFFSILLWSGVIEKKLDYKKVKVLVSDVELVGPSKGNYRTEYKITVFHEGEAKKLENVKNGYSYYIGNEVEVFESNGRLYEDLAGVGTNTPQASYYFISLGVNFVFLYILVYNILAYKRQRASIS